MNFDCEKIEADTLQLGREIYGEFPQKGHSIFAKRFYTEKLLELGMEDEEVKLNLFRFIDVLPTLTNSTTLAKHIKEYFTPVAQKVPRALRLGLKISENSVAAKFLFSVIHKQVELIASEFIAGANLSSARETLLQIIAQKRCFTLDLLGEKVVGEEEALQFLEKYKILIESLSANKWANSTANISVKLSALYSQIKPVAHKHAVSILTSRLVELISHAKKHSTFVYIDMEDTAMTSIILDSFKTALMTEELRLYPHVGIVLQAYLKRTNSDLNQLLDWTKKRGAPIAIRLVKGAYWDSETVIANQRNWELPVWKMKEETDANFEKLSLVLLKNSKLIYPAFASHNLRSLCFAISAANNLHISNSDFEFQTLFGMAHEIKLSLTKRDFTVREYVPIGDLLPGMSYLVRRLLENTANEGFLRQSFFEHQSIDTLLKKPEGDFNENQISSTSAFNKFTNCPLLNFSEENNRDGIAREIEQIVKSATERPLAIFPEIGGKKIKSAQFVDAVSADNRSLQLAKVHLADRNTAERAISHLNSNFSTWKDTSVIERAKCLFKAAELIKSKRYKLTALIVLESAKPWAEADGDVTEAIDFLNYYAIEALKLFEGKQLLSPAGERNVYSYEARGVTLIISPWNFPLAIPCGMIAASLVCGNPVAFKPAEQSTVIAFELYKILLESGIPKSALSFLPGFGEDIGEFLVAHKDVSTIAFTGSRSVGLAINAAAANRSNRSQHIPRVIAEMGGKNAIILDSDADLDDAISGIIYSAFGYQGQKCSACSRVIVHSEIYNDFLRRIKDATESICVGSASSPETFVGPLIDEESYLRLLDITDDAKKLATLVAEGSRAVSLSGQKSNSFIFPPMVFSDIPRNHSMLTEELFGPVLAIIKANTFKEAVDIANDTEYGLTAGVYSRSPANIEYAAKNLAVGNIYINRQCTGACVMRQPFGGAKMSGVGSKAGGPDYLLQFVIPKTVTENTLRRGFTPKH